MVRIQKNSSLIFPERVLLKCRLLIAETDGPNEALGGQHRAQHLRPSTISEICIYHFGSGNRGIELLRIDRLQNL